MSESGGFDTAFARVLKSEALTAEAMRGAVSAMLAGAVEPVRMASFLTALHLRGETPDEVAGAALAMRAAARRIEAPDRTLDTCGTGGTGLHTRNVSTAVALVLAGLGVPVAKHGNRAASSLTGSSDVLSQLGVRLDVGLERTETILRETGLVFLFAPNHHPGMAHVAPVRKALGFRTIFNLLGPLSNPAGARRQLLGVYDGALCRPVAEALRTSGAEAAWVVHGEDGMDELTVCGASRVCALREGALYEFSVTPEEAGVDHHRPGALRGGAPDENAAALRALLAGAPGAYRDAVLLNAAAGLIVADETASLAHGASLAAEAIDDGRAQAALDRLVEATHA
ncbi:anthranilate phosphoribosyltransferase [Parvularcula dongshanensis]|uniref:Anthranilate phosphoribosyltransferase n=1 Tax=Parvularcula dongshanensis TaxID=1173995 RepID=A0A840I587_9PROT|nr:anthranilate phosphoribosyltransferase [Parvularcula dongshanensis]MBB4659542.1 anthranilate phosphoribosyltransferase [Parvularcula dongshanensis]